MERFGVRRIWWLAEGGFNFWQKLYDKKMGVFAVILAKCVCGVALRCVFGVQQPTTND